MEELNQIISYIMENKPVLTAMAILLWWLERNGRLSAEKRERVLLRELADCPPEPIEENVAQKIGVIASTMAVVATASVFLVGCGSYTQNPTVTPQGVTQSATDEYPTPTRIATPGIIEVTAMSDWKWDTIGVYTPTTLDMNIRECSQVNDELCPIVGEVKRDESVQFYSIVRIASSGDVWLCLDSDPIAGGLESQCGEMVAWWLGGVEFGKVSMENPAG